MWIASLRGAALSLGFAVHTFGTQTLKRYSVKFDNKIAVFLGFLINLVPVGARNVKNSGTLSTMEMIMPISSSVITYCLITCVHTNDLTFLCEYLQISVYRSKTHSSGLRDYLKNFSCGWMLTGAIVDLTNRFQD
jgi:hypothetical protein